MPDPWRFAIPLAVASTAIYVCTPASEAKRQEVKASVPWLVMRVAVDAADTNGLSGLGVGPNGMLYSVSERRRLLLPLPLASATSGITAGAPIALVRVEAGEDTESVAWLSADRIALGTERHTSGRPSEDVLLAKRNNGRLSVYDRIAIPYRYWGLAARANKGIEGLCYAGGWLLAAFEQVIREGGHRYAPIARIDPDGQAIIPLRLKLVSKTGKLSALDCRAVPGEQRLQALAVERHYGVVRLLRFSVPLFGESTTLEPESSTDLKTALGADLPNLEGIAWLVDGRVVMISDNDTGGVTGPAQLFVLTGANPP